MNNEIKGVILKQEIQSALSNFAGDYAEIRIQKETRTEVHYQKEDLENLETSTERGGFVRVLADGGWGAATFNRLENIKSKLREALQIARVVGKESRDPITIAPAQTVQKEFPASHSADFTDVNIAEKQELAKSYNDLMLNYDSKIQSTTTRYTDSLTVITFANTDGSYIRQEVPDITLTLVSVARDKGRNIQKAHESIGEAQGFDTVKGKEKTAKEVAERSLRLLEAKGVKGGNYTVILNPDLAGVFIHEAFGHLCEADHLSRNERLRDMMELGRRFGPPELNVVDDGYIAGRRGNTPYDDEGVERKKTYLIKDGVLNHFLHSRETAARMDSEPTGNARAISYRHEPIVRMTNTYIESGDGSFESMLDDIDRGIYAKDAFGGQTQLEQFTFSAGYAYEIRNGELGSMLRDVVLTGNVFETLKNVERIGDDLQIIGSAGGCGKEGQSPLPVTDGAPHLMIKDVTIGGR